MLKGELVAKLILFILIAILLDGIIRQVDVDVAQVLRVILLARCTDITLFEEVELEVVSHQCPNTHIKFTVVYQKGTLYVLLHDKTEGFYFHNVGLRDRLLRGYRLLRRYLGLGFRLRLLDLGFDLGRLRL